MSIHKVIARSKTRYRVIYREPNSRNTKSKTFDKKQEAEGFEAALRIAKNGGTQVKRQSTQTLADFGQEYLDRYAKVELEAATLNANRSAWNAHIRPALGDRRLSSIGIEAVQEFSASMKRAHAGDATRRRTLAVLSSVLQRAVEWERIPSNPVRAVRKPSAKRKREIEPLAVPTIDKLIHAMPGGLPDAKLVALLAYAGLRPGEALALHASDIGDSFISVTKSLKLDGVGETKTGQSRMVPILPPLVEWLDNGPTEAPLFLTSHGKPWTNTTYRNWRSRVFQPTAEKIGLGRLQHPYDLRHTAASWWLKDGEDVVKVAQWMGHSLAVLSSTYAHVIAEAKDEKRMNETEFAQYPRRKPLHS